MQKLVKKLYVKKNVFKFDKYSKLSYKTQKVLFYTKKNIKYKFYRKNPLEQKEFQKKKYSTLLSIRITANNAFCNLKNNNKNKLLAVCSSGKYRVKSSKKNLRFTVKLILSFFIRKIKSKLKKKILLITIIAPSRIRKQIILYLSQTLKKKSLVVKVREKKCFNGCRPAKKKRKKQKRLRILK